MHTDFQRADESSGKVIGAAMEVHREKGPGLIINFHEELLKSGIKRMILPGANR